MRKDHKSSSLSIWSRVGEVVSALLFLLGRIQNHNHGHGWLFLFFVIAVEFPNEWAVTSCRMYLEISHFTSGSKHKPRRLMCVCVCWGSKYYFIEEQPKDQNFIFLSVRACRDETYGWHGLSFITRKVGCCCLTFENGDRDNDGRLVHTRNRQCGGKIRIDLEGRFVGILIVAKLRLFVHVIQSRNSSVQRPN